MITWLTEKVGSALFARIIIGLIAAALIGAVFAIGRCSHHDTTAEQQAKQTSASGEAISNAAAAAVDTIQNQTVTEHDIDKATAVAALEINAAADPDAVRNAVLNNVCASAAHVNDPACVK